MLVNGALDGRQGCYLAFDFQKYVLYLVDDAGTGLLPGVSFNANIPASGTLANSQCSVNLAGASVIFGNETPTAKTLTVNLPLTFAPPFSGNKIVYQAARDQLQNNTGWIPMGTWQVPGAPSSVSTSVALALPAQGSGFTQQVEIDASDTAGLQHIGVVNILVNDALDGRHGCFLAYAKSINVLYLVNDSGDALLPSFVLNRSGSVGNSQCTINGAATSALANGNSLRLTLNITYSEAFRGNRVVFAAARDVNEGNNPGWLAVGSWTVQ